MNRDSIEDVVCWTSGALATAGAAYALWPRIEPWLVPIAAVAIGFGLIAALELWANRHAFRNTKPEAPEAQRKRALDRYRAAQGAHELALKCVAGLRFQQSLRNRRRTE